MSGCVSKSLMKVSRYSRFLFLASETRLEDLFRRVKSKIVSQKCILLKMSSGRILSSI